MDEDKLIEIINEKFESVGELLGSILENQEDIREYIHTKTIIKQTLADFSKAPKTKSTYAKPMPEQIGGYTIAKKGCNRCGGKITWDNYNETDHKFPDHVDENGSIIDCPEYKPTY